MTLSTSIDCCRNPSAHATAVSKFVSDIASLALMAVLLPSVVAAQKTPSPLRMNEVHRIGPASNPVTGLVWEDPGQVSRVLITWSGNVVWKALRGQPPNPEQECEIVFDGRPTRGMVIRFPVYREGDYCRPYVQNFQIVTWGDGSYGGSFYSCTTTETTDPICCRVNNTCGEGGGPDPGSIPGPDPTNRLSFSGVFNSSFGTVNMIQNGSTVTGTYSYDNGRLEGQVTGNRLIGTWSEAPSYAAPNDAGELELTLSEDGMRFTGRWRYGSSGGWRSWSGDRVPGTPTLGSQGGPPTQTHAKTSFSGAFESSFGTVNMTQNGSTVTGTYSYDNGRLKGQVTGNRLIGTWSEAPSYAAPNDAGDLEINLSEDGMRFTGRWRYGSSGGWRNWNGTRISQD